MDENTAYANVTSDSQVFNEGNNEGQSRAEDYDSYISPSRMITPPIGPKDENYRMNNEIKGKALIFNHEKYAEARNLEERKGTVADVDILKDSLEQLNFEVAVFDDLTVPDIHKQLQEVSQQDHRNEDCIIIAVLTHGTNVSGKDKLYAYDQSYDVEVLWSYFTADMCPTLAGKPKIFLIQACRGKTASEKMSFKTKIQRDSSRMDMANSSHRYTIPVEADIVIAFSTYEGRVAHRNVQEGSWFIQELCSELKMNGEQLDLLSLLTNVNRRVAIDCQYGPDKQMPVIQSTLTRKLFLGSQPAGSNVPQITVDLNNMLDQMDKKLDQIIKINETKPPPTPTQKTKPGKKPSLSSWESLQVPTQRTAEVALPSSETVHEHGELLKVILEGDKIQLSPSIREYGMLILNFLSCWEILNNDKKLCAYKNLILFLNEHAKSWDMFKFLKIPDPSIFSPQHCHRRWSQSDVTDAGRTPSRISKISSLPRRQK